MNVSQLSYGQGKPIVFFHGWGFDHQIWLPLVPLLNNKYQLILVDLPGFGQTPMMHAAANGNDELVFRRTLCLTISY